jgi:hypothetical protein
MAMGTANAVSAVMRPFLLTALLVTAACEPTERVTPLLSARRFVIDDLVLPMARSELALDLNGDGAPDNQLGKLVSGLTRVPIDMQAAVDRERQGRGFAPEIVLYSTSATFSPVTVGAAVLDGDATFFLRADGGGFRSTDDPPPSFALDWPFLAGGPAKMVGAHLALRFDGDQMVNGQLNAGLPKEEVDAHMVPFLTDLLNRVLYDATMPLASMILPIFDIGGRADVTCPGSSCRNRDGSCAVAGNHHIEECETRTNSIMVGMLSPDVQLFTNGSYAPSPKNEQRDSLSVGIGFHAQALE